MSERDSESQNELHFYYNREERIKNAPRTVKDFYGGKMKTPPKGLIKALVATKASRIMFLTLVCLTAVGIAISLVEKTSNTDKKDGIRYELTAFSFDDVIYATVKLDENSGYGKKADIYVTFMAKDKSGTVAAKNSTQGTYSGKESFFRTTFNDYDIIEIEAVVQTGEKNIILTAPVKKQ